MNIEFAGHYKSLFSFVWTDIPPLVVLTGPNGSGKTQLLDLIHRSLAGEDRHAQTYGKRHRRAQDGIETSARCTATDIELKPTEVVLLTDRWHMHEAGAFNFAAIQKRDEETFRSFSSYLLRDRRSELIDAKLRVAFDKIRDKHGDLASNLLPAQVVSEVPDDIWLNAYDVLNQQIPQIYYYYSIRARELKAQNLTDDQVVSKIGNAPWEILDSILQASGLPFEVNNPLQGTVQQPFILRLTHTIQGGEVGFGELSSGEQVLLGLVFFLFYREHVGMFPRLLLLDEPDAHLHPALTRRLFDVIDRVLVQKYNVRVILTTHSPSTVALAPKGSVFEMPIRDSGPEKCSCRNRAIKGLTSGIVTVLSGTQFVIVESGDDRQFFTDAHDVLMVAGRLDPARSLVFISAADRRNSGGGKTQVEQWAKKLAGSGLDQIICGLRDSDGDEVKSPYVHVLPRYTLENYLLDPIVVYGVLLDYGFTLDIPEIAVSHRGFRDLVSLDAVQLQVVADHIHEKVRNRLGWVIGKEDPVQPVRLVLQRGGEVVTRELTYPSWLKHANGKDLLRVYQQVFGGSVVNKERLLDMFKSLQIVPDDLESTLKTLQESSQ